MENAGAITFRERLLLADRSHGVGRRAQDGGRRSSRTRSRTSGSAIW